MISVKTDHSIKQGLFQLVKKATIYSLLTPSGLILKLKQSIDAIRFQSNKTGKIWRKKNELDEVGYANIMI